MTVTSTKIKVCKGENKSVQGEKKGECAGNNCLKAIDILTSWADSDLQGKICTDLFTCNTHSL